LDNGWLAISQLDSLGVQFDPVHSGGYWQTLLARHGAERVETPGSTDRRWGRQNTSALIALPEAGRRQARDGFP
jgi:hypothetical protein